MQIKIKKRNQTYEPLYVEKTKRMIAFACDGLSGCDPIELELDAQIQFVDGMSTKEIQKVLIQTAIEKVIRSKQGDNGSFSKETHTNWQYVAARLFLFDLYKEAIKDVETQFAIYDEIREYNQLKVLKAFQEERISESHFTNSSGYGYDDIGRWDIHSF